MEAVIFDFGRTLYDRETERVFPDAFGVLEKLSEKYKLAIVSLTRGDDIESRFNILKLNNLDHYFDPIIFEFV